jgi:hypothetical protein
MKYPAVAMLLATKAFTRAIRSASECSFKTMVLGFLATVFAVEDSTGSLRLAGGGLPPRDGVLIWSGHRVSQSSDWYLRGVAHFHLRFHRYIHLFSCRLGMLRNKFRPLGWGCYVTSPAYWAGRWLRNGPSPLGWACYVTSPTAPIQNSNGEQRNKEIAKTFTCSTYSNAHI